jgi:A/G-specific adenine glycosylase
MKATIGIEHNIDLATFHKDLEDWGKEHFRSFPWRFTTYPYHILMAEIMLHRTQASQVAPIYERFIASYPDIPSLSSASQEEIHSILYSLGLRWRVGLIIDMVRKINKDFAGQIPQEKADLLSLPGISEYIANAVRCFAYNLPDAIIDTNTVRVIGRVFGLEIKDSSRRNPLFRKLIYNLLDLERPRVYNFALLDLAAQVCTKVHRPSCGLCPIKQHCIYGKTQM